MTGRTRATVLWTYRLDGEFLGTRFAGLTDGCILNVSEPGDQSLIGLNSKGRVRWRIESAGTFVRGAAGVWVGGDDVQLIDPANGTVSATRPLRGKPMVLAEGVFFLGSVDDGSICGLNDALEVQWEWTEDAGSYVVADGATLCRTSATGIELVDIPTLQRRVVALSVPVALGTVFRAGNVIAKYSMGRGDSWAVDTVSRQTVWQKTSLQFGFVARWRDAVIWCDEALSAADIGSGALLWETPLNSRVIKGVKVVGDRCYFGDEEGNITVLDCATGTPLFQKELPSGSRALDICLVVPMGDDALLVGTRDRILCLQMD